MPSVAESAVEPTATVSVRAEEAADVDVAVTVTEVADAPSLTVDGLADSVTAGYASSSASVIVVPVTVVRGSDPTTLIVSSPSFVVSWIGVSVKVPVPVVAFAGIVMWKFCTSL